MGIFVSLGAGLLILVGACAPSVPVAEASQPEPTVPVAPESPMPAEPVTPVVEPPKPSTTRPTNPRRLHQLDELQVVKIKIGEHSFDAWVMDTESKRQEGMMFLKNTDFKDSEAMIFVFKQEQELGFWMRNTLVDLDIAYVNARKTIVRAVTMKALDETSVPSRGPSKYAIEFRAGTFKKLGIRAGQKVEIPASVQAKE